MENFLTHGVCSQASVPHRAELFDKPPHAGPRQPKKPPPQYLLQQQHLYAAAAPKETTSCDESYFNEKATGAEERSEWNKLAGNADSEWNPSSANSEESVLVAIPTQLNEQSMEEDGRCGSASGSIGMAIREAV